MSLHAVFSIIILQMTFFSVYTILKMTHAFDSINPQTVMFTLGGSQRRPYLRLLPTHARASALCVMGGRQRLLSDALSFLHMHGLHTRVMVNGLARAGGSATY